MHLKLLLSLLSFLFLSDGGGPADDDSTSEDDATKSDDTSKGDDNAGPKSALDKERSAARDARRDLKTAQAKLSEIENANTSDADKLKAAEDRATAAEDRATAAENRVRVSNARSAVYDAVAPGKANAISARAVFALVQSDLEFDDDGEPTNVDALIAQAKKDEPDLFRAAAGSADGGARDSTAREVQPGVDRLAYAYETQSKTARNR